jgi:hypothetical protein
MILSKKRQFWEMKETFIYNSAVCSIEAGNGGNNRLMERKAHNSVLEGKKVYGWEHSENSIITEFLFGYASSSTKLKYWIVLSDVNEFGSTYIGYQRQCLNAFLTINL